jgi:hypothetical protein
VNWNTLEPFWAETSRWFQKDRMYMPRKWSLYIGNATVLPNASLSCVKIPKQIGTANNLIDLGNQAFWQTPFLP